MKSFTRIIPKQGCENWPAKLGKMGNLYQEAEYQTVKKKIREAAILSVPPENFESWFQRFNSDGLIFTPLKKTKREGGFSYRVETPEPGETFSWLGCLTRTKKEAEIFRKSYQKSHRIIGEMLGYPDCCIDYFIKSFPINYDPIWLDSEGKIKGYPEANGLLRYFGPKIVAHYACSPTCQATREVGRKWLEVMEEIDKDLTKEMYDLLAEPITWNSYHGVIQVDTPYFIGLVNGFPLVEKPKIIEWKGVREKTIKRHQKGKKSN